MKLHRTLLQSLSLAALAFPASAFAASDPAGDSAEASSDLVSLDVARSGGSLVVHLTTAAAPTSENTQLLIDTDLDGATGFSVGSLGADVMLEGPRIYTFKGEDTSAWSWDTAGVAKRQVDGAKVTLTLPGSVVGSGAVSLVVRTIDSAYAEADRAPDDAGLLVGPGGGDAAAPAVPSAGGGEAAGDADDPSRDLVSATVRVEGTDAVVTATTVADFDPATTLIFFDTDNDPTTGHRPSADPAFGFEMAVIGGKLMEHTGADPAAWSWRDRGAVEQKAAGKALTVRIPAGQLRSTNPGVAIWNMSADWQGLVDKVPDAGLMQLTIAPSAIVAPEPEAVVPMAPRKANADLPARERIAASTSFYCYYGSGRVAELSQYDVAVMHSPQMAVSDIAKLNELGVVTAGYITVGEDDEMRVGDGTGPDGKASWYFDRDADGKPDQNGIWKSWYANADDPNWRADRVKEAKRLVEEEGYDGIFLDTIDTAQLYPETADGMVQLVADLREALPDSPIILNQGFKLFDRLAPMADGLMLESFTATYDFEAAEYKLNSPASLDAHTRNVNATLQPVLVDYPMPIFVLDYARATDRENIRIAADRAATFGYQFASSSIYLDEVHVNDIRGEADPKWLEMQATPELMSIQLATPSNGFPVNTKISPSSCFAGYSVAALVDGIENRSELPWNRSAWASSEHDNGAWLLVDLPTPEKAGELWITWATDAGVLHKAEDFRVETRVAGGGWREAGEPTSVDAETSVISLGAEPYDEVRVVMAKGGGSPERPDLLWIAQLELNAG